MLNQDECLHELRFMVPDIEESLSAEALRDDLQRKAGLSSTGEAVARIGDVSIVAPRGKHDLEFFPQFVKMHGKTQTYTIKYRNIARLFLLNMPNQKQVVFVIGLDQPVRQGQQLHSFLALEMNKDKLTEVKLSPDKMSELSYQECTQDAEYAFCAKLFKSLAGKAVVAPASECRTPGNCVRCTHKTASGHLFPLKKSLIFVTKPIVWHRYDDIDSIELGANKMRRNSFDLVVNLKTKVKVEFFQKMGVRISNLSEVRSQLAGGGGGGGGTASRPAKGAPPARGGHGQARQQESDPDEEDEDSDFDEKAPKSGSSSSSDLEDR